MKKIILVILFNLIFIQIKAIDSNTISKEITLVLNYRYDWAPNYVVVIHVDNTGLLRMSVGQTDYMCNYWDNNTFNDISDYYLEESYRLNQEEISELNKLLREEKSLYFIDEDRVISGFQYFIYLDGILFFKLSDFYFEHPVETSEIEGIPYGEIIENPKKLIGILTKRIENKFNLF